MELRKNWHNKRTVNLYGLIQPGLIILCESGVVYFNQAGGYSCMQPCEEGVLTIIGEDYGMSDQVLNNLSQYLSNNTRLTEEDANYVDHIFKKR